MHAAGKKQYSVLISEVFNTCFKLKLTLLIPPELNDWKNKEEMSKTV